MRKNIFKTILLSLLAAVVLISGMTSFAASVSTVTAYNHSSGNIHVTTNVFGATAGSMVAYLVTKGDGNTVNSGTVLYAYQKTADNNGDVEFTYEIDKTKLPNTESLATSVKFGSDQTLNIVPDANVNKETLTNKSYAAELGLLNIEESITGEGATIAYYTDSGCQQPADGTTGFGETVYAQVTLAQNYEIDSVTVDGNSGDPNALVYEVRKSISITTEETAAPAGIAAVKRVTAVYNKGTADELTGYGYMIRKTAGNIDEVGIKYGNYYYPALLTSSSELHPISDNTNLDKLNESNRSQSDICTVVLIFGGNADDNNLKGPVSAEDAWVAMTPYYKVNGTYFDGNTDLEIVEDENPELQAAISIPVPELVEEWALPKNANIVIEDIEDIEDSFDDNENVVSENSEEPVETEPENEEIELDENAENNVNE